MVEIIPVIDLLDDEVVRGVAGERSKYQAISSPLCPSSEPASIVDAFLQLAPFDTIYIADLNALQNKGDCSTCIDTLFKRFPNISFWIDAAFDSVDKLKVYRHHQGFKPILATEVIDSLEQYQHIATTIPDRQYVLSLDHKGGRLGSNDLFIKPELWPKQVIVMSMDNVGKNAGPSFDLLAEYQTMAPSKDFVAAGGVRDNADIVELENRGIKAALVASALHNGQLDCRQWYRE